MTRLILPDKITSKMAQEKISTYIQYANHSHGFRPKTGAEIAKALRSLGYDPEKLARYCRDFRKPVPAFENLVGSTWRTTGNFSVIDKVTSKVVGEVKGDGVMSLSPYQTHLEEAYAARDSAIRNESFTDMGVMTLHGIAAIEGFFALLANRWNENHPDDLLLDSKEYKVSLLSKFDVWIPKMEPTAQIPKDDLCWNDFRLLLKIRDSVAHPKVDTIGNTLKELAQAINAYKHGIALNLMRMHNIFRCYFPAILINSYFFPDVVIDKDKQNT